MLQGHRPAEFFIHSWDGLEEVEFSNMVSKWEFKESNGETS